MYWYDGNLIEADTIQLDLTDPALIYGATIFTTLRVYQRSLEHDLTQWESHCYRLYQSLKALQWQLPNWEKLRRGAEILLLHYPVLRITLLSDGREWIVGRFLPEDLVLNQQEGVRGWVANNSLYHRSLAIHKTGNYLGAWLALQQAKKLGATEAILVATNQNWLETSTGNLWGWKEGSWWTPPIEAGILPGIGRLQLLNWLNYQQIPVFEREWTADFIKTLEVIAYSNSVVEMIPFHRIDCLSEKITFNVSHPVLRQLRDYYISYQ